MNEWRSDGQKWCCFHPKELVVGICALCLKEKLLLLAANHQTRKTRDKPPSPLTKIFALTTLLNRLEVKHHNEDDHISSSQDESFISIKFENNGAASWEKEKSSEVSHDQQREMPRNEAKKTKSLVEHPKPRGTLRWRRRIGHLIHLIRFKRSNKGNMCHVGTRHRKSKV